MNTPVNKGEERKRSYILRKYFFIQDRKIVYTIVFLYEAMITKEEAQKLLDEAFTGDIDAFGELYRKYLEPSMVKYARKYLKNETDAEDVVQKIFVYLFEKSRYLNIHEKAIDDFKRYILYYVTKPKCIDVLRKRKRLPLPEDDTIQDNAILSSGILDIIILGELLRTLSDKERDFIYQRFWMGKTLQELAGEKRVGIRAIQSRLKRILDKLLSYANDDYKGDE